MCILGRHVMAMLYIVYLSVWSYQGHVLYLNLYYLHATSKNEIHICSNKHETGLVNIACSFVE